LAAVDIDDCPIVITSTRIRRKIRSRENQDLPHRLKPDRVAQREKSIGSKTTLRESTAERTRTTLSDFATFKRGSKLAEAVARDILKRICEGGLIPGSQLPSEAQMLSDYDVGRGTLREGLRILEVHGIIRIKAGPGGGPVVVGTTTKDFGRMMTMYIQAGGMTIREVIDVRLVLEPIMARLAAERRSPELVEKLLALQTVTHSDKAYLRTSEEFHRFVASMSQNRILSLISHAMEDIFHERVVGLLFPPERRDDVVDAHKAIARAISAGNGELAEALMREHMTDYARYVAQRHPALMDEVVSWH
jgi:GntR family transcriptional regulator, transcriptional repressor for pyruvate dehydrogenase complex